MDEFFPEDGTNALRQREVDRVPGRLVRAEANLLRFPLFALHTKGLKSLDGIECTGRLTRDGETQKFTIRATRNTATLYPGPLARSAHIAFLSILTEEGLPVRQPLEWSWRDLCRRMGITYGGRTVEHLKDAILSTAGIIIRSESALFAKASGHRITTQEEALHLYDRVVFVGTQLQDGRMADTNFLWLSDWYCENIDALFTAPLDYSLWRTLDEKSPIASRLYEFLLLNFYGPARLLKINYETLVQFLPIHPEKYLSSAKRQMQTALQLLKDAQVLGSVGWQESKRSLAQLHFERSVLLSTPQGSLLASPPEILPQIPEDVSVRELRNLRPPQWQIVYDFYREWSGECLHQPTPKELAQAEALVSTHGVTKARSILTFAVKRLRTEWPEAKTFGAVAAYLPEALRDDERNEERIKREHLEREKEQQEDEQSARKKLEHEELVRQWKPAWELLDAMERQAIEKTVRQKWPHFARVPRLFERKCLEELSRSSAVEK